MQKETKKIRADISKTENNRENFKKLKVISLKILKNLLAKLIKKGEKHRLTILGIKQRIILQITEGQETLYLYVSKQYQNNWINIYKNMRLSSYFIPYTEIEIYFLNLKAKTRTFPEENIGEYV